MRHEVKDEELERILEEHRAKQETSTCVHYWLIESAQGHTSRGLCKFCGEERVFLNSMPDYASLKPGSGFFDLPGLKDVFFDEEQGEVKGENGG